MRKFVQLFVILAVIMMTSITIYGGDMSGDEAAIKETTLNYLEGWYEGNPERMEKALHADLQKVGIMPDRNSGKLMLRHLSKSELVEYAKAKYGKLKEGEESGIQIEILDQYENIAIVKTLTKDFVDYLHVVRTNGEWKIINVLWEPVKK